MDIRETRSYAARPGFYDHPVIRELAEKEKWTISYDKKPLNVQAIADGALNRGHIPGALEPKAPYLSTLEYLVSLAPDTIFANHTFYLDALADNYIVVDVEPKCPVEIKQWFLTMPYLYAEVSMSGNGLHLVFKTPTDILDKYPIAKNKRALIHSKKYYEVLMDHYCTFTGRMYPPSQNTDMTAFNEMFEELCQTQKAPVKADTDFDADEPQDIPNKKWLMRRMLQKNPDRTLEDYDNDNSKYEICTANFYLWTLHNLIKVVNQSYDLPHHEYSDTEKAWLVYYALQEKLEYRPKHDTARSGDPWLLYLAKSAVSYRNANSKDNKNPKDASDLTLPDDYIEQVSRDDDE